MTIPGASRAIDVPAAGGWRQQFARPTGLLGRLAGYFMAFRNKERSWWVLPLLEIHDKDRVLEVGFGPGVDIRRVSEMAVKGFVAGVDHSEVMLEQARQRNQAAIQAGRVELHLSAADRLPFPDGSFEKVFSINVAHFWAEPVVPLREMRRVLREGGRIAIAVQPRTKGANERTARETAKMIVENLNAAGFTQVRMESKKMRPVSVVCGLGVK